MRRFLIACGLAAAAAPLHAQITQPAFDYGIANVANGRWTYGATASGSVATFYDRSSQPLLTFTCTRVSRQISIARPATATAPFLFVWATSMNRNLPASFNPATNLIAASLSAYDKLFDALAFSRGRIVVGASNGTALVAPAFPEIIRVVEDCRA